MMKLAIFDIDDTLYEGTSGVDLIKALIKGKSFEKKARERFFSIFKDYKNGEILREDVYDLVYSTYGEGIKGHIGHKLSAS